MTSSRILKVITGLFELALAIPLLGGSLVIASGYSLLGFMFILHLVTLTLSWFNKEPFYGSVLGVITSALAWIPIVGWMLHLLSGILLLISSAQRGRRAVS
ncbi:hypothetical protein [Paenibacillus humicola]|uniref:hypothetical protein n=1 Tax=Paenibacillus humicola TaxID=3110540 RepID=UPI00237BD915|nr:hypothetical protein [Paenibacillus humicola]